MSATTNGGSGSGSYYTDYMRANALLKHGAPNDHAARRLLTDRGAYISFLEAQLERVSAACLTAQGVDARLAALEAARGDHETQLTALSRVARLSQELAEQAKHDEQAKDDDLRALVFALETRVDGMQSATLDTDKHLAFLKDLVTDRFDKELEIVRTSVSEKCFTMDSKLKRLSDALEDLPHQLETSWKSDLIHVQRVQEENASALRNEIARARTEQARDLAEMKDVLRKCLDTQHLLSTTIVAIQSDVDEQKQTEAEHTRLAIDDLRENQHKLKDALRLLQTCAQQAQHENQESCRGLTDRLQAAEETFAQLTEESLGRADELRTRMLVALGEVEQKLRQDADLVAEQAVRSVRIESECQYKQMMGFTSA